MAFNNYLRSQNVLLLTNLYRTKYKYKRNTSLHYNRSSGYYDELAWAAVWLYKATDKKEYLENAKTRLLLSNKNNKNLYKFDWDHKQIGVNIMLAQITRKLDSKSYLIYLCLITEKKLKFKKACITELIIFVY